MCAFCGGGVEGGPVDPCALIVVARWRTPGPEQRSNSSSRTPSAYARDCTPT